MIAVFDAKIEEASVRRECAHLTGYNGSRRATKGRIVQLLDL